MTINTIQSFFRNRANLIGFCLAVLGAYLLFPAYFEMVIEPLIYKKDPWQSLDNSWALAMNYNNIKGSDWGNNFVFTYGPLGSFCTRIAWGHGRALFLILDIFVFANYLLLFFLCFRKSSDKITTTMVMLITIVGLPFWVGPAQAIVLLLLLVFWIRISLDDPKPLYYFFQISIIVLLFFLKFNVGLIVFGLFFLGLFYNGFSGNLKKRHAIGIALLPVMAIMILAPLCNVAVIPYIMAGIGLITGYNAIMYFDSLMPNAFYYFLAMAVVFSILLTLRIFKEKLRPFKASVVFLLFAIPFFVMYKQGFVRADASHLADFFYFIPLLVLCTTDLHFRRHYHLTVPLLLGALWMPFQFLAVDLKYPLLLAEKCNKSNYIKQIIDFSPNSGYQMGNAKQKLPANIIGKIGNHTIDVFPWDIRLLLDNGLNYAPRPVCQSYSAYTPDLENRNFTHYNGKDAPSFVLYEYVPTDNRYPLFDEPKVQLALSKNYEISEQFEFDGRKFLLLEKQQNFKPLRFKKLKTFVMNSQTPLVPEENTYYGMRIANTMAGNIASVFEHAPEISLEIKIQGESPKNFRTARPLLETGIFGTQFIGDTPDAEAFFDNKGTNKKIEHYLLKPQNPLLFCDTIEVTTYEIVH